MKMHYYTTRCLIIIVRLFLLHYLHGLLSIGLAYHYALL